MHPLDGDVGNRSRSNGLGHCAANPDMSKEKIDRPLEQHDYATTTKPTVGDSSSTMSDRLQQSKLF